ncbi:unnamed protein product, partial [Rotaria sp. Silwood1]
RLTMKAVIPKPKVPKIRCLPNKFELSNVKKVMVVDNDVAIAKRTRPNIIKNIYNNINKICFG